jgi:aspartate aminotransferase-like enzyme
VREAGSRQMVNHRGPEFKALIERVVAGLKRAFNTQNDVLLLGCSGTGGLEAAIVNHLSPDDAVLGVSIGSFGDRFAKIAARYGADVTKLDVEWGQAADPAEVSRAIEAMKREGRTPKAVLLTFNETSTGITNPLQEVAAAVRAAAPDSLILVDAVSGLGAVALETDAWDLDVVVTGSQKSWMVPPGLAMVAVSKRAWAASEQAQMPRFYFDLAAHRTFLEKGETPWTPMISVLFQLDVSLGILEREGWEAIYQRHIACGEATRAGLEAMGFRLFADRRHASDTCTAAWLPDGADWSVLGKELRGRGLVLAGGQGKLAGRIFRVGHLGAVTVDEILAALEILEDGAAAVGIDMKRGVATDAAARAADTALGTPSEAAVADEALATTA